MLPRETRERLPRFDPGKFPAFIDPDLLRGPGKITGLKQHGAAGFKIADVLRDSELLKYAKEDAEWLISDAPALLNDPGFAKKLEIFRMNGIDASFKA